MICANFSDIACYRGLHPRLDRALDLLTPEFLASVGTERQEIEGDALYVTRYDKMTSSDESRRFEYHRRYLDIFTLTEGCERVDVATPEALTVVDQHDDCWRCEGKAEQGVILRPGRFVVLFPGDAHRAGMAVREPENVSRIVFKIEI